MTIEKSRIKFVKSKETGEIIGFVSRHPANKELRGVSEHSVYGKKICVLSEDIKGTVLPDVLYEVELKPMHNGQGYVVVSARRVLFEARFETVVIPRAVYQVRVTFGFKTVYFDPLKGRSPSSRTINGVLKIISSRNDILDRDAVIAQFRQEAHALLDQMERDGYLIPRQLELFE